MTKKEIPNHKELTTYSKPIWRWITAFQHDFVSRAYWCVKSYDEANHFPVVSINIVNDIKASLGESLNLSAKATNPYSDKLSYLWWHYFEAGSYNGTIIIKNTKNKRNHLLYHLMPRCEKQTI